MPTLVLLLDALVAGTLFAGTRRRWLFLLAVSALALVLIARSKPRTVGDAGEYIAMSVNMARLSPPSLSLDELKDATTYVPGDAGVRLVKPEYRARDGRQDFPHFWFYSLLAAPFVRVALAVNADPIVGFTILNGLLLLAAALALERRFSAAVAAFVVAGPILWWIDKAHTEVFTVSLLSLAIAFLQPAPWWSIVALGMAATQNPPIAGAMIIAAGYAVAVKGWRDRRIWIALAAGTSLAALHPLYFHSRLGVWSGLYLGVDQHLPGSRELLAAVADPNLGVLANDPFLTLAIVAAFITAWVRRPAGIFEARHIATALVVVLFTCSFTQTGNFNSGGTPSMSRYGLWLVPLAVPLLATAGASTWMRVIAVASVVWCSAHFAPAVPEEYLRPTPLAARIWHQWPDFDNPLAEVFAERVSGREPSPPLPLATDDCEKLLLAGNGTTVVWPAACAPEPTIPSVCRESGALCYANRAISSYSFAKADASPAWLAWERNPAPPETVREDVPASAFALPPVDSPQPALWLDQGWSYLEHESGIAGGTVTWRWMGDRARIGIVAPAPMRARLRIVARAIGRSRRLRLSIGGTQITELSVAEGRSQFDTPPFDLAAGQNFLALECLDGSDMPGGPDARRLSVALFHAEIVP